MRHHIPARTAASLLVALSALAAALPSSAAVCTNVVFGLINDSDGPIQVTQIGYRDLDSANTATRRVENVRDFACPSGDTCFTTPQDLGSITTPRRNHELTDIQFRHRHQDEFGAWLPEVWSSANEPVTLTCTNGRTYGNYHVN